jgi:hypothetical protein
LLAQLFKASKRIAKVQVANLFNRPPDIALQKINHLAGDNQSKPTALDDMEKSTTSHKAAGAAR